MDLRDVLFRCLLVNTNFQFYLRHGLLILICPDFPRTISDKRVKKQTNMHCPLFVRGSSFQIYRRLKNRILMINAKVPEMY